MKFFSSLYKRKEQAAESHVWIGLDFGTATTECVLRVETRGMSDSLYVFAVSGDSRSNAAVIIPSAVESNGTRICCGGAINGAGRVQDNLKLDIIAEVNAGADTEKLFRPEGACTYTVMHLATILGMARKAIAKCLNGRRLSFYLNVAAPIGADGGNATDRRLAEVFHEIAYRALAASDQCASFTLDPRTYQALLRQTSALRIPDSGDSPVTVVPEALAAVTAFLQAPDREVGNYATVDIGGGSTDVSFFWFHQGRYDGTQQKEACYYSVRTAPVGMSQLATALQHSLAGCAGRTSHERLARSGEMAQHADHPAMIRLLSDITKTYKGAFGDAFALVPEFRRWLQSDTSVWELLLLGGGCGDAYVQGQLDTHTPNNLIKYHRNTRYLRAPANLNILLPNGRVLEDSDAARKVRGVGGLEPVSHLLTVAYGLGFRAPDIPRYDQHEYLAPRKPPKAWEPPPHTIHA